MITKLFQKEREEEIEKAAYVYTNKKWLGLMGDEARNQFNREEVVKAFIAGAKFADNSPKKGLVEIEDVEDIYYMAWLRERECFMDYLKDRCRKEGWI